jgi:hypothetical protein
MSTGFSPMIVLKLFTRALLGEHGSGSSLALGIIVSYPSKMISSHAHNRVKCATTLPAPVSRVTVAPGFKSRHFGTALNIPLASSLRCSQRRPEADARPPQYWEA